MTICSCLVVSFNQESSLVRQILWPQHLKLFSTETISKVSKYYTFKNERQETLPCCNVQLRGDFLQSRVFFGVNAQNLATRPCVK